MRFLSLLATSGCALVDAAGEPKGNGSRVSFRSDTIQNTGATPLMAVVGEINGSPGRDVLVLSEIGPGNSSLFVCTNMGDTATFTVMEQPGVIGHEIVAAADLDGDGRTEIILAGPGKLDVLVPMPGGGFMPPIDLVAFSIGSEISTIKTGLFEIGSTRAIVLAYSTSPDVQIISDPLAQASVATVESSVPKDIAVGSFKSNGIEEELLIAESDPAQIAEFSGPGLVERRSVGLFDGAARANVLVTGDFGSESGGTDGVPDVAFLEISVGPGIGRVFHGTSAGLATSNRTFVDDLCVVGQDCPNIVRDMVSGDFDGDGDADIAALVQTQGAQGLRIRFFLTAADGTFDVEELAVSGTPSSLGVGDLNGDGTDDVLLVPGVQPNSVDLLVSR